MRRALGELLTESPLTVETRALVLDPKSEIFGDPDRLERSVLRDRSARLIAAVGRAGREELAAATAGLDGWWEVIAPIEEHERLTRLLPTWRPEPALIYDWPRAEPGPSARVEAPVAARVEAKVELILDPRPELIAHLKGRQAREIGQALGRVPLAAAIIDGLGVSFCYAYLETETLWAVAVETLEGYRRRGLASACCRCLIEHQLTRGKKPVWGAHVGNAASQALALGLGFRLCGRISALERPTPDPDA